MYNVVNSRWTARQEQSQITGLHNSTKIHCLHPTNSDNEISTYQRVHPEQRSQTHEQLTQSAVLQKQLAVETKTLEAVPAKLNRSADPPATTLQSSYTTSVNMLLQPTRLLITRQHTAAACLLAWLSPTPSYCSEHGQPANTL